MTFELIAAAYFTAIAVLSPFAGAPVRRWAAVMAMAFGTAAAVVVMSRTLSVQPRAWMALGYLAAGYWLPALLVSRPPAAFEAWLRRTEVVRGRSFLVAEIAYLVCTPLPPAAFLIVSAHGTTDDIDRFWTAVLVAAFACYISLPWLVSRPPRLLEDALVDPSPLRRLNLGALDRFSHGWNTFPSGHVAVSLATALALMPVSMPAGSVFLTIAILILIGAVWGRYHYTVDAVAGVVVGIAAAWMARW